MTDKDKTPAGERERAAVKHWLKERGATFQFTTWIVEPGQKYDQGEYISTEEAMVRYAEAARREERKRCVEIVCPRCAKGDPLQEGCHYQETECDLNCGEGEPLMRKERHNYQECPAQKLRGEER